MKTVEECVEEVSKDKIPSKELEVLGYLKLVKLPRVLWEYLEKVAVDENQDVGEVISLFLLDAIRRKLFPS